MAAIPISEKIASAEASKGSIDTAARIKISCSSPINQGAAIKTIDPCFLFLPFSVAIKSTCSMVCLIL